MTEALSDQHATLGDGKFLDANADITAAAATVTGDAADPDKLNPQFHPIIDKNEKIFMKDNDPTDKDGAPAWKNYKFEAQFDDNTKQEFLFTAKDDGDAKQKVEDRVKATKNQNGTYKLSLVSAPEIASGEFGGADKKAADKKAADKAAANEPK